MWRFLLRALEITALTSQPPAPAHAHTATRMCPPGGQSTHGAAATAMGGPQHGAALTHEGVHAEVPQRTKPQFCLSLVSSSIKCEAGSSKEFKKFYDPTEKEKKERNTHTSVSEQGVREEDGGLSEGILWTPPSLTPAHSEGLAPTLLGSFSCATTVREFHKMHPEPVTLTNWGGHWNSSLKKQRFFPNSSETSQPLKNQMLSPTGPDRACQAAAREGRGYLSQVTMCWPGSGREAHANYRGSAARSLER